MNRMYFIGNIVLLILLLSWSTITKATICCFVYEFLIAPLGVAKSLTIILMLEILMLILIYHL